MQESITRKGARAAEWASLERMCARKGTASSNLAPSVFSRKDFLLHWGETPSRVGGADTFLYGSRPDTPQLAAESASLSP